MNHVSPHSYPNHRATRVLAREYPAMTSPAGAALLDEHGNITDRSKRARFSLEAVGEPGDPVGLPTAKIAWRTPLRDDGRRVWARVDGRWLDVEQTYQVSRDQIRRAYAALFNGDGRVPERWVFGNFGRATLYRFRDQEHNAVNDVVSAKTGQRPTVASSSAALAVHARVRGASVAGRGHHLFYADGCIHLRPEDFDDMRTRGFLADGALVVVHSHLELSVAPGLPAPWVQPPYELHFYPKAEAVYVYGWQAHAASHMR